MNTTFISRSLLVTTAALSIPLLHGEDQGIPSVMQAGDDPNIGIKYKSNAGLFVTDISAEIIDLKMAEVEERHLARTLRLEAQIYDVAPAGRALASAWMPAADSALLMPGTAVAAPEHRSGKVTKISTLTARSNDKAEVLLEVEDPGDVLKVGQFLPVTITLPSAGNVVVVPKSAVLRNSEGTFAYVDNAGWKARTAITTGGEQDGFVEVTDGLLSGDSVVTNPVMTLWMTELQMTKSGKA